MEMDLAGRGAAGLYERSGFDWGEGNDACVVVPPFVKYAAGPMLGPAHLQGTANAAGFDVCTLDLNIEWMHCSSLLPPAGTGQDAFFGDHSKPRGVLDRIESAFWSHVMEALPSGNRSLACLRRIRDMTLTHDEVQALLDHLVPKLVGKSLSAPLSRRAAPGVLGLSVMWSAQVTPALVLSSWAKSRWPGTKVVWGGPHITAIADAVAEDSRYGRWVDGFLPRHCEDSFVILLESVHDGGFEAPGLITPGGGKPNEPPRASALPPAPEFPDLALYGRPRLVLPAQLSRGCAYGRCAFCTYPAIEGVYTPLDLGVLKPIVQMAARHGGSVSFKDSLVTPGRLLQVAGVIRGRVQWSACTKLHPALDCDLLDVLATGGCRTLEVGLETIDPEVQRLIDKQQPLRLLDQLLSAAETAGVSVIVNYITGFPGENPARAQVQRASLKKRLRRFRRLHARVEHNEFVLERLAPMAKVPDRYGIRITRQWPWSSILEWEPCQ